MVTAIEDPNSRVRQVAIEGMAVVYSILGSHTLGLLATAGASESCRGKLSERFQSPALPRIDETGFVEHQVGKYLNKGVFGWKFQNFLAEKNPPPKSSTGNVCPDSLSHTITTGMVSKDAHPLKCLVCVDWSEDLYLLGEMQSCFIWDCDMIVLGSHPSQQITATVVLFRE